jgi:hypothetical protein
VTAQDPKAASALTFSVWDFGGQRIFTELHHLFLTAYGAYCLMFNMEWLVARPDSKEHRKCIRYLRFWLKSIAVHTVVEVGGSLSFAPVYLLGTHKDKVPATAQHEEISKLLDEEFGDLLVWQSALQHYRQLCFFPIDNTAGQKDQVVRHVMEAVHERVRDEPYVTDMVPFTWLALFDKLQAHPHSFVGLAEVQQMAKSLGFPTGADSLETEVGLLLAFFDQVIIYARA